MFVISRTEGDTSFINFNATADFDLSYIDKLYLECTTGTEQASCPMDYISRASEAASTCKVQFTNNPWSVVGQCSIAKTFSGRGRYRCRIYESNEKQGGRMLRNTTMHTISTGVDEFSGNCTFSSYLPPDGRYNYTAVIIPGEVEIPFLFKGSDEIRTTSATPSHNCPKIVREGEDVKCACSVSDYGAPSGTLQWDNTGSTQLSLTDITTGDTGRRFGCRLTWNNTDVWTVNYTLIVTCSPRAASDKSFQSTSFKDEKAHLWFNLTAYPTPELGNVIYLGPTRRKVPEFLVDANCTNEKDQLSSFICVLTISNMTSTDTGNYCVTFWNSLGQLELMFEVKIENAELQHEPLTADNSSTDSTLEIGLGFGVTVGVFTILPVAAVVWVWRRKWVLPCQHVKENSGVRGMHSSEDRENPDTSRTTGNAYYVLHLNDVGMKSVYSCLSTRTTALTNLSNCYDNIHLNEMGMKSEYSSLSTENQRNLYDALHLNDVGLKSVYSSLTTETYNTRESADYELTTEAASNQGQQMHNRGGHR